MMRAFVGIALPAGVRDVLVALQRELSQSQADVKWVEPENLHFTLKFLDEISEDQRQEVERMLGRIAAQATPFPIQLTRLGAFPSLTAPRVVWVGMSEGKEPLTRIAQAIEEGARAMGLRREERPFASHLTLGRVRSPQRREELAQRLRTLQWTAPPAWQVSAITLYQSVLNSSGPHYGMLADIPLGETRDRRHETGAQ